MTTMHSISSTLLATILVAGGASAVSGCGGTTNPTPGTSGTTSQIPSAGTGTPTADASPGSSAAPVKPAKPVPVENNPPGDIPDNLAFIPYPNRAGAYSFTHPEGWARTGRGVHVRFTDKLNGVDVQSLVAAQPTTVASARADDVPRLSASVPAFQLRDIAAVTVPAGRGVRIVFRRNSDADPVTGKVYRDEVEEYIVFARGRVVRMDLFGPVGADNVDAYRTMLQSLKIR
jgi:hypothetical protein